MNHSKQQLGLWAALKTLHTVQCCCFTACLTAQVESSEIVVVWDSTSILKHVRVSDECLVNHSATM